MNAQQEKWLNGAGQLVELFDVAGDTGRGALARLIWQRLALPQAYVTVVGETSTGKSSLVNALLAKPVLPVSASPTTGIVTHIVCRDEPRPSLLAIYRDATQDFIDEAQFQRLSLNPGEDLLRLQARAAPKSFANVGLHVFDTPGYNAVLSRHEEVLMTFLPQSDVIVFVVGHRTGFGQSDQDLFEAVAVATDHDKDIPLLLVVNRAPQGCDASDKRISEIRRLAEDGLKRRMGLHIVHSTKVTAADGTIEHLPMAADGLWEEVRRQAFDAQRLEAVQYKLEQQLLQLIDEADAAAERDEALYMASPEERQSIEETLASMRKGKMESQREINVTIARLEAALPRLVESLIERVKPVLDAEIVASDKWLGHADCAEWIAGHCLPVQVRAIGRKIEDYIAIEVEALNQRLEEIANTAIAELDSAVSMRGDDPARRFALNLVSTLGQRLAGNAINSMLRGLGGVGGAAAGAGNLVKIMVSRAGRLFGKTFSREVYKQIGRTFSKKMLERLNIAAQVVIEVVSFVREAMIWQDNLIKSSHEALDQWRSEVVKDLLEQHIPQIRQANHDIVAALYDCDSPAEAAESVAAREARLSAVQIYRRQLANLRLNLMPVFIS
jgi:hypothetical protein